jgi:hypothetical protein
MFLLFGPRANGSRCGCTESELNATFVRIFCSKRLFSFKDLAKHIATKDGR